MKKVLSLIITLIILVTTVISVSALDTLLGAGTFYTADGMEGILVTSSNCPLITEKPGSAAFFDHNKKTGYAFIFEEGESKTVTVIAASRECKILDRYAFIATLPEGGSVDVKVYATSDASLKEWTELTSTSVDEESEYKAFDISGIKEGYAFYRFDFELTSGNEIALAELSLLTSHIDTPATTEEEVKKGGTLMEREPWRMVRGIFGLNQKMRYRT